MIGPRPTLGWIGFVLLGKSWLRITVVLTVLCAATVLLLRRSQQSITLQFIKPAPFPPPVIIIHRPNFPPLTSFDACAVEASLGDAPDPATGGRKMRKTYLYLWTSSVNPEDRWAILLYGFKDIKVSFLDTAKVLRGTPLYSIIEFGGWGGRPKWAIWATFGAALLHHSGGLLMPTGVLMQQPIGIESTDATDGLLTIREERVRPIAFGLQSHNVVLQKLTQLLLNTTSTIFQSTPDEVNQEISSSGHNFRPTPLELLLTKAVQEACDINSLDDLPFGACPELNSINAEQVVDVAFEKMDAWVYAPSNLREKTLLVRYTGNTEILRDPQKALTFLQKTGLGKRCPRILKVLQKEASEL